MIFIQVMLPVLIMISIGFITGKLVSDFHLKSLSRLSVYILSPALIFTSLKESILTAKDAVELWLFCFLLTLLIMSANYLFVRFFKLSQPKSSALNLSTIFMNVGNYGIPVALYAFGQAGVEREIVIMLYQTFLVNTLGVFLASRSSLNWKKAALKVFQIPPVYAFLLAIIVNIANLQIPEGVYESLKMMGESSIPIFLILLGLQLARTTIKDNLKFILSASSIRLLLSPLLALLLIKLLSIDGLNARVLLMASATPTGVVATMYSIEMDAKPQLVSGTTFVTTILSFATMSVLINFLM